MSYQLVEKQVIYDGKKVRLEIHHLEDPETGRRHKREVCVHPGAVVVLLATVECLFEPSAAFERRRQQIVDLELVLARVGALGHVERCLERADRIARRCGAPRHLNTILFCAAMAETTLGHLAKADALEAEDRDASVASEQDGRRS